ncbi:trehalose-6-phosphate synthase [Actinoallomurus sp. NPDC050550]|uniref:trehalose-6-phosphate synthase n=1 Tax=Actinoallomurus sp. NPDC050550 TaxID=3154937 RepID=UPI0033ECCC2C
MRLIVCSNSAPRWQDGAGLLPRSPGGLVPLLATLLGEHGGDWVCTMPVDGPSGPSRGDVSVEVTRRPCGGTPSAVSRDGSVEVTRPPGGAPPSAALADGPTQATWPPGDGTPVGAPGDGPSAVPGGSVQATWPPGDGTPSAALADGRVQATWPHGGGTPSGVPGDGSVEVTRLPGEVTLHRLRLPRDMVDRHYETIGVRLLLWLFHYLLDTSRQPDGRLAEAWSGYEAVNRAYADRVATLMTGSPDEFVLVNDHHLFLVPEMLGRRGGRRGRVAFFQGLPWCEPDYFGVLPAYIRDRILASLLCADVIGFHCTRWARAFLGCCARYLPGCAVDDDGVTYDGYRTRVVVAPFPLDVAAVERLLDEPATAEWRGRLDREGRGRRMIVRADRIDLWKNLPRGFTAYRNLLEREPGLAGEWWFCAVATPPGRPTERTLALQRECEGMVADLNERFGAPGRPAVSLIYPDPATTRNCVVAALSGADVMVVNPTFDGMNLVAKEALFLGERARLLLSVNAGAYEQLADHVTPVHPFDVEATASAMLDAMAAGDVPAGRAAARRSLREQDANSWLDRMMGARR